MFLLNDNGTLDHRSRVEDTEKSYVANVSDTAAYMEMVNATGSALTETEELDDTKWLCERLALDLRTTRRFSPVGAGVEVRGALLTPTVKLVADEAMSEKDKLSWLVLGRAPDELGRSDAALLQRAVLAVEQANQRGGKGEVLGGEFAVEVIDRDRSPAHKPLGD